MKFSRNTDPRQEVRDFFGHLSSVATIDHNSSMANESQILIIACLGCFLLGVVLLTILLPLSFHALEYYEYGFSRQKTTGTVDTSTVYAAGNHLIGPNSEFKIFPADAQDVELKDITAFTSDKLEVAVTARFQYFLRQRDLPLLHKAFDLYYHDIIKSKAIDALKSAVTVFTKHDLYLRRPDVQKVLYKAVRERVGGICCPVNCDKDLEGCPSGCKAVGCLDADKGAFVDVKFFQVTDIDLPYDVLSQRLRNLLEIENAEKVKAEQESQIIRKDINKQVKNIKNEAIEISEMAEASASLIYSQARANYTLIVETARSKGLKLLYKTLNINSQEHRNSFDYLRTLRGLDNVHLTVDFQQHIVGNL